MTESSTRHPGRVGVDGARAATAAMFAAHGAVAGSYASRLPWIADHVGATPGGLGLAMLFSAVGAMTAMTFAGPLVQRRPVRRTGPVLLGLFGASLVLPALAPTLPALCLAILCYGAAAGSADVVINAQGVAVERAAGRSMMSGLHGMWSLGGLLGSGAGALAAYADVGAPTHFAVTAVVVAAVTAVAARRLPDTAATAATADDAGTAGSAGAPRFALPSLTVLPIALVGFVAIFVEVAGSGWAALYLADVTHAAPAVAAAAFSVFAATMATARLLGDRVVDRYGPVAGVRAGGVAAAVGAVLVAVARTPWPAIVGFGLIGIGVAVVVPLAFAAAGNAGPHPGQQIAGVATIAYGAGMAAPAAIGAIAAVSSLPTAFMVTAGAACLLVFGAHTLRRRAVTDHHVGGAPG